MTLYYIFKKNSNDNEIKINGPNITCSAFLKQYNVSKKNKNKKLSKIEYL